MKKLLLSIYASFITISLFAQVGCTDPQANNYDADAIENDGSCTYPSTSYTPEYKSQLGDQLEEISAMIEYDGRYFGLADSGNPSSLYEFNPNTGFIFKTIKLKGIENVDWESMTRDDTYAYVGDTGNNKSGNRQDLVIYKFPLADLDNYTKIPNNHIESLLFHYEDQVDFSEHSKFDNRYDCEAIVAIKDSIYLFTKDWKEFKTRYYTIPKVPTGDYAANLQDSLNVSGLVTDASVTNDSIVVLVGYSLTGKHFLELLFNFKDQQLFSGNTRQILITHNELKQAEALILHSNLKGIIGSEYRNNHKQALFDFDLNFWIADPKVSLLDIFNSGNQLSIFPNPVKSGTITVEIPTPLKNNPLQIYWLDSSGRQHPNHTIINNGFAKINIPSKALPGLHYILIQGAGYSFVGKLTIIN